MGFPQPPSGGGGSGTVTNVSSANANLTVANPTTTPVLTIVGAPPNGSAGGDLAGTYPNPTAIGITAPTDATIATGTGGVSGDLIGKTNTVERFRVLFGGNITIPDTAMSSSVQGQVYLPASVTNSTYAGLQGPLLVQGTATGNLGVTGEGLASLHIAANDAAGVVNKTISSWADNGSGLFQATTSTAHGFSTGDKILVYGVTVTTTPNGAWTITVDSTTKFSLQGSTFAAGATGGTATNRPYMAGLYVSVNPLVDRGGLTGGLANADDVGPIIVQNVGTGKSSEAFYVAVAPNISGSAYSAGLSIGGKVDNGIQFGNAVAGYGIDFHFSASATYGSGTIRLPNGAGGKVVARNNADSADVTMFNLNTSDQFQITPVASFLDDVRIADGHNIVAGSTNGIKIGTAGGAAGQKIGFFNATPVTQQLLATGTGKTVDNVITVLQTLGLCRQS